MSSSGPATQLVKAPPTRTLAQHGAPTCRPPGIRGRNHRQAVKLTLRLFDRNAPDLTEATLERLGT